MEIFSAQLQGNCLINIIFNKKLVLHKNSWLISVTAAARVLELCRLLCVDDIGTVDLHHEVILIIGVLLC